MSFKNVDLIVSQVEKEAIFAVNLIEYTIIQGLTCVLMRFL